MWKSLCCDRGTCGSPQPGPSLHPPPPQAAGQGLCPRGQVQLWGSTQGRLQALPGLGSVGLASCPLGPRGGHSVARWLPRLCCSSGEAPGTQSFATHLPMHVRCPRGAAVGRGSNASPLGHTLTGDQRLLPMLGPSAPSPQEKPPARGISGQRICETPVFCPQSGADGRPQAPPGAICLPVPEALSTGPAALSQQGPAWWRPWQAGHASQRLHCFIHSVLRKAKAPDGRACGYPPVWATPDLRGAGTTEEGRGVTPAPRASAVWPQAGAPPSLCLGLLPGSTVQRTLSRRQTSQGINEGRVLRAVPGPQEEPLRLRGVHPLRRAAGSRSLRKLPSSPPELGR